MTTRLIALLALAGCTAAPPAPDPGPAPVVRVVAGVPDTLALADLGLDPPVVPGEWPGVRVATLGPDRLVVTADVGAESLMPVPLATASGPGTLVVRVLAEQEAAFRVSPPLRPLQVAPRAVAVVFADGRRLALTADGDAWTGRTTLPTGRHLYRLDVDGRSVLDPGAPAATVDGVAYNVVEVGAEGRLTLSLVGVDPESPDLLRFSLRRTDAAGAEVFSEIEEETGVVALLDGQVFQDNAIDAFDDYVVLDLDAAGRGRQRLRVIAQAEGLVSDWITVDLVDGRPVGL